MFQFRDEEGNWHDTSSPVQFREKPEVKPDAVLRGVLSNDDFIIASLNSGTPNIECTFSGETGELLTAEVLK